MTIWTSLCSKCCFVLIKVLLLRCIARKSWFAARFTAAETYYSIKSNPNCPHLDPPLQSHRRWDTSYAVPQTSAVTETQQASEDDYVTVVLTRRAIQLHTVRWGSAILSEWQKINSRSLYYWSGFFFTWLRGLCTYFYQIVPYALW